MNRPLLFRAAVALICLTHVGLAAPQSLAEAARKEAQRRKALEQQGVEGKVVSAGPAPAARTAEPAATERRATPRAGADQAGLSRTRVSLRSLRTALQKLDRDIRQSEDRLSSLRARMEAEKWKLPKVGRSSRVSASSSAGERLRVQIQDLEAKLKRLRSERYDTYEAGRKAGYLPGELDGKGIVP